MLESRNKTLILGAAPRLSLTISRCLWEEGVPSIIATPYKYEKQLRSRSVSGFARLPPLQNIDECRKQLLSMIERDSVDCLMPTGDAMMNLVGGCYDSVSSLAYPGCPRPEVMERVLDKQLTLQAAETCGIDVPRSLLVSSAEDVLQSIRDMQFPLIAKPNIRKGASLYKIKYFENVAELQQEIEIAPENFADVLLQEFVPGTGIGIGTLYSDGAPLATFQHRRLKEFPHTGGVSVKALSEIPDPTLKKAAYSLLEEIGWQGIAMVEFRYDPASGRYALMEINGRYWGSLFLTRHAGLNFPYYEWALAHGLSPNIPRDYSSGVKARWFVGDYRRLKGVYSDPGPEFLRRSKLKETMSFITDSIITPRGAMWSWRDPTPAFDEVAAELKQEIKRCVSPILETILPRTVKYPLGKYRELGPTLRPIYLKRHMQRLTKIIATSPRGKLGDYSSVLFVCFGNIMRSPMAAVLAQRTAAEMGLDVQLASVGTWRGLEKTVRPSPEHVQQVAPEFGVSLAQHLSSPLTAATVRDADIIFVMDYNNEACVLRDYPESAPRVFLLRSLLTSNPSELELPDPYGKDMEELRGCYQIIDECIDAFSRQPG